MKKVVLNIGVTVDDDKDSNDVAEDVRDLLEDYFSGTIRYVSASEVG
jgi:hypothetical protein